MKKTITIIISKASQLDFFNIKAIPSQLRETANFVLVINENLYKKINNRNLFAQIICVKVNYVNELEIFHLESELTNALGLITANYSNIYVFTTDEVNLETIEKVTSRFNIPYWGQNTGLICRNKILMKQHMQKHNIRTPKFFSYSVQMGFAELEQKLNLPFVLKPIDQCGSIGVCIINNHEDYQNFLSQYKPSQNYQAEEFIKGTLFHIDSVKYNEHLYVTIAEYTYPMGEFANNKIMGSIEVLPEHKDYLKLISFNESVVKCLNNNGCFHHEVFISERGEIIFLEIAWRQAGKPVNEIFTQHFGFPQTILFIMLHLGSGIHYSANYNSDTYTIEYYLPKKIGTYRGVKLPNLHGKTEVINLQPINSVIDTPPLFYSDIIAIIKLSYPPITQCYKLIVEDFTVLKNTELL